MQKFTWYHVMFLEFFYPKNWSVKKYILLQKNDKNYRTFSTREFFFFFFFCLAFPRYLSKTTSTKDPRSRKNPCNRSRSTNWIRSNYPAGCRVFKGSLRIRAENFRQIDTRENTIGTPTVIERRWYRRKNDRDICRAHHILWLRFVLAIRSIGSR